MTEWASFSSLLGRSSEEGIPDNHVVTIVERSLSVDIPELIQNNIKTDTVTLELDAEWDGISPVIIFECSDADYQVQYEGSPAHIPQAVMKSTGSVGLSVCGYDDTGEIRLVTKAAPSTFTVVASGSFIGEISEDDVSLLGQILAAAEAANEAAQKVATASFSMGTVTTLEPGEQASASLDGEGLQKTLNLSIPKGDKGDPGDKGDQGDPGDKGDQGDPGDKGDPGTAATIAVGNVTGLDAGASPTVVNSGTANAAVLDFGIPKGDKGDKGDPGRTPQRGVDYWTAEDVEAVVEDTKAQAVAELAEIGNVPKRTVSDLVAHGEDAYAQKPIEVRVKGRTVKNLWPVINGTSSGISVSTDDTGLIKVTGRRDDGGDGSGNTVAIAGVGTISPGTYSYILSTTNGISNSSDVAGVMLYVSGRTSSSYFEQALSKSTGTIIVPNDAINGGFYIGVTKSTNIEVNVSIRVMLVDGNTAPDCFVPTGLHSVEPTKLVTAGKNLLSDAILQQVAAIQSKNIEYADGVMTVNSNNDSAWNKVPTVMTVPPGDYVASFTGSGAKFDVGDGTNKIADTYGTNFVHFSLEVETSLSFKFTSEDAATFPVTLTNIQLELGSTATAYEPPNVTTTPLPEVELRSLPDGTCDELVIGTDGTCEVERNVLVVTMDGSEDEAWVYNGNSKEASIVIPGGYGELYSGISTDIWSDRFPSTGTTRDKYGCAVTVSGPSSSIAMTLYVGNPGVFTNTDTVKSFFQSNPTTFIVRAKPTTEPQSPVTLPTLPAPTFNQYHDADIPSDTSVEYARDINIVLANLEAVQAALLGGE